MPLKQTRDSKTHSCLPIDFISKNNNYLCTSIDKASLINLTIIQYQERILKGISELSKLSYPITKESILPYVFDEGTSSKEKEIVNEHTDNKQSLFEDIEGITTLSKTSRTNIDLTIDEKNKKSIYLFDYLEKYYNDDITYHCNLYPFITSYKKHQEELNVLHQYELREE